MIETDLLDELNAWVDGDGDEAADDLAYGWIPNEFPWEVEVTQKANTADRDNSWPVQTVIKIGNRYFAIDGFCNSWEGTEWTSGWYEAEPVQVQVTEYHRKLDY